MAGHDYDRALRVTRWPIREAMLAYLDMMRRQALEDYRVEYQVWAALAPHAAKKMDPPKKPAILRS